MSDNLGEHEGREIIETSIVIRKTGDGLSAAMKVDPQLLHLGDEGYVALEYKVVAVDLVAEDRKDPSFGGVKRIHVLDAGTATFIDAETVAAAIVEQRERNLRWEAEQRGQHELGDADLIAAHDLGEHASGLVEHCPRCIAETEAEAEERRAAMGVVGE